MGKGFLKISLTNSKLGGFIPCINLPPIITCRQNAPCIKSCYACKGNCRYKNVVASWGFNLSQYLSDSKKYFDYIQNFLNGGLVVYKYFRWHSSGDIVDLEYFKGVVSVAKNMPLTKHLLFTKKYELVNQYLKEGGKIPNNLSVVFSAWGDDFVFKNPHNLPIAYIRFKSGLNCNNIPVDAVVCGGSCATCQKCWHLKKGESVVFNQH